MSSSTVVTNRTNFKDLWSVATDEKAKIEDERIAKLEALGKQDEDTTIVIVGSQNAGKSSFVSRFLDREERKRSTIGLEYTYSRMTKGAKLGKTTCNCWELGGGSSLAQLVDIPITAQRVSQTSVIIMLDLSKPEELWTTLEVFMKQIRRSVNGALTKVKATNPSVVGKLDHKAWLKFGRKHPDKDMLNPLLIPLVIIGGKYDIYQDFDPEKKKIICKTLRFIAHTNGASLMFFSIKSDALVHHAKLMFSNLAFGTEQSVIDSKDYTKPLYILAGSDSLGHIGAPSLSSGDLGRINARNPIELWKQAFCTFFELHVSPTQGDDDPCKDKKYLEPVVDSMKAQKDEELEQYRRNCEKEQKQFLQRIA